MRFFSGSWPGRISATYQEPSRPGTRRVALRFGRTPALIRDDLPDPEPPSTTTICCRDRRPITFSTSRSRPKKNSPSRLEAAQPGIRLRTDVIVSNAAPTLQGLFVGKIDVPPRRLRMFKP